MSTFWNPSFFTKTAQSRTIHLQNLLKSSKSFRTFVRKSKKINDGCFLDLWSFGKRLQDQPQNRTGQAKKRKRLWSVLLLSFLWSANFVKNLFPFFDLPPKSSEPAQWWWTGQKTHPQTNTDSYWKRQKEISRQLCSPPSVEPPEKEDGEASWLLLHFLRTSVCLHNHQHHNTSIKTSPAVLAQHTSARVWSSMWRPLWQPLLSTTIDSYESAFSLGDLAIKWLCN